MGSNKSHSSNISKSPRQVETVGFGLRLAATLVDAVFVLFITFLVVFILGLLELMTSWRVSGSSARWDVVIGIVSLLISIIYYVAQWAIRGQTVGKLVLNIQVVGKDGKPPTLLQSILRYVGYLISGIVFSIGFIWVALDKKNRGWHDLLAGTYVVSADDADLLSKSPKIVASSKSKGWVWVVIWAVLAIGAPSSLTAMFFFLGPMVNTLISGWLVK